MNEDTQKMSSGGWLSISEAARHLRVSKDTLRRWEKNKIIKSYRSPTNHRYYKKEELEYVFSQKPELEEEPKKSHPTVKTQTESKFPFIIISLLTIYIVLMIFLAWLLLQQ